ncbi:MAG: RNA polymerase sigma factor [Polyangia bacterium]|jgi:RNA polymerase sigma-70 factor (ECF subfamily)
MASESSSNPVRFTEHEREFVFGVAMKYMKDEEKAADVTQDALLLAYRHRDSFRGDSRFTTWLYRIAATTALMHLRKDRGRPQLQSLSDDEEGAADEPRSLYASPEEEWAATEAVALAGERLGRMGDKYGRIFAMRFLEGYSETEIAHALRLNVSTVKTRAYRARSFLKRELERATDLPALAA